MEERFSFSNVCQGVPDISRPGILIDGLRLRPKNPLEDLQQFIQGHPLPRRNIHHFAASVRNGHGRRLASTTSPT
jgi:hypothetical protein